jgi:hypothetical protein
MTLGAFAAGANESGVGLFSLYLGPLAIDEKRRDHQRESQDEGDEYWPEAHLRSWYPSAMHYFDISDFLVSRPRWSHPP